MAESSGTASAESSQGAGSSQTPAGYSTTGGYSRAGPGYSRTSTGYSSNGADYQRGSSYLNAPRGYAQAKNGYSGMTAIAPLHPSLEKYGVIHNSPSVLGEAPAPQEFYKQGTVDHKCPTCGGFSLFGAGCDMCKIRTH